MDIERFKQHHTEILNGIEELRRYTHAGVHEHARDIAQSIESLSSTVKLHLAIEDRILYPSLQKGGDPHLAAMSREYQEDMKGIASEYIAFSRRWNSAAALKADAETFRAEANVVLKALYMRMLRENTEFYPAIEAA